MRASLILPTQRPTADLQTVVAGLALTSDECAEVEVILVGLNEPLPHPSPEKGGALAPLNPSPNPSPEKGGGYEWSSPPSLPGKGAGELGPHLAAWNVGAAQAQGDILVFLDEAAQPTPGWLAALLAAAEAHPAAVIGSCLLYPDDTVRQAGYVIGQDHTPRPLYPGWPANHPVVRRPRALQAVAGVGMLVPRSRFLDIGGFDLDLGEWADVDLCLRLRERGGQVYLCSASRLYHLAAEPDGPDTAGLAAFRQRWANRLRPDDVATYQADGQIQVEYPSTYPLRLNLSPRLVTMGGDQATLTETWLEVRTAQVAEKTGEIVRSGAPASRSEPARPVASPAHAPLPTPSPEKGGASDSPFPLREGGRGVGSTRPRPHPSPEKGGASASPSLVGKGAGGLGLHPPAPLDGEAEPSFPYPPPDLVFRVVGAAGLDYFLQSGQMTEEDFRLALADVGKTYAAFEAIYDFGCGSGRVLRWVRAAAPHARLYGSDIDIPAITWLRRALPDVDVRVNNYLPPLPFRDGLFDLVLGFSVLTHLDETYQDAWLAELHRVTRPGGLLLLTVHGEYAWREFRRTTLAQVEAVAALEAELRAAGFLFWRGDGWERHFPDYYHSSWHLPDYIHRHWSRWFSVLRIRERGARTIQDMVVLRREA
ncbi:MAG: methyltransferase domain-containing protein [Anaerolineae bacterium]|nr:methyltransferase domain-containing protein [Anaerolineae bacterium]